MKAKVKCITKILLIIISFAVLKSYSNQWEVFTAKNDVRDIALSGNTLWAATTGGVVAWNLVDNSYKSYTTADGLISCNINQVAIDKKGRPWVATKEPCGLFVYENHAWKQMGVGNVDIENIDHNIFGLEVDQFGNVWIFVQDECGWLYLGGCGWILNEEYLWRYDGQTLHKHEGVYGPVGLDPQKNLLAVDSLSCYNYSALIQFGIASFNGSEFVSKWLSKVNNEKNHYSVPSYQYQELSS